MPGRITELSESQIVADLLADRRRQAAATTSVQMPQPAKDTFTVASTPATTYTLSAIPYQGTGGSSLNFSLNGVELIEGVDYTVDYTTAIVTVTATLKGTPTPADVLTADYWTTGDLIALTGPADGGLALLSDWTQDGGTWTLDTTATPNKFKVTGAGGGTAGTRFGGAFAGYYAMIHNNGAATVHFTANTRHASSAGGDGFTVAFNPATGSGYKISWDGGTFHGGIQLYRFTNDTTGAEVANAVGAPIPTGDYDAKIEVIYNSATGAISVYFDSVASGLTTLRISYTDGTPLTGTWFGMLEWYSNLGAGKWWNWALL